MKVSKSSQVKGHPRSQKWKDARGRRWRHPINPSDLNSSPVIAEMAKEHQAAVRKKPNIKRLKKKAMAVSGSKKGSPDQSGFKKSSAHTNGSLVFTMDSESGDSQDWSAYAQSVLETGAETSDGTETVSSGRLEGEAFRHCAERDDRQNHAVLVMQKDQVWKSTMNHLFNNLLTHIRHIFSPTELRHCC